MECYNNDLLKYMKNYNKHCQSCKDVRPYADHTLIPQRSTGSSISGYQMKAHIFLIANPKFQLQILCSFGDISKKCEVKWYTRK